MKAVVCRRYGSADMLALRELARPEPADNELLIRVQASAVTTADTMMRRGRPLFGRLFTGLRRPKHPVLGTGFAGDVVGVGKQVKNFSPGDTVFGETGLSFGANAEYVCVAEDGLLLKKPAWLSYAQAAPVCDGALTSMSFLQQLARLQAGQRVLVNAASGSLGTAAVQLARHFGAEVTAVCSAANLEMVSALGAHHVIDYRQQDFTRTDKPYDIIYDTIGRRSYTECRPALTAEGLYMSPVLSMGLMLQMLRTSRSAGQRAAFSATGLKPVSELLALLNALTALMEQGVLTTVIDRCYSLEQAVEAHRYVDLGHKKGSVVLTTADQVRPNA